MKRISLRMLTYVAFLLVTISVTTCGDTTTSDETKSLDTSESRDLYPFDDPPVLIVYEPPEYPEKAKQAGLEGEVTVKVLVSVSGAVESVNVLSSSDPIFEASATDAAFRCEFRPAKLEGKPTRSQVMIPYHFRLDI